MTRDADPAFPHPLDPLTEDEVISATAAWRASGLIAPVANVHVCALFEPPKEELLAHRPGDPVDRRVRFLIREPLTGTVLDVVASATTGKVLIQERLEDAQPPFTLDELLNSIFAVVADQRFIAGCAARGVFDLTHVQLDPWPAGRFGHAWETREDGRTRRTTRLVAYWREDPQDNGYAHPLDGLIATVDLDSFEVVDVLDQGARPVPRATSRYEGQHARPARGTARPIEITQPHGTSFALTGNHVSWEKWRFRFTAHPVTGLVIHNVTYDGRSVAHRLGLSEMVVPYAGTGINTAWKNAFDAGELSMGVLVNSLELGCDCIGDITYVDAIFADHRGQPARIPKVVCLHEEDAGIAWKHTDLHGGTVELRRARRFVVNSVITAGNYEYAFRWMFHTDGRLELEVQLTGIAQTELANPDGSAPVATRLITPALAAAHHQHLFNVRLDLDIDGSDNCVVESDIVARPDLGEHVWEQQDTVIEAEGAAARDLVPGRRWRVINQGSRNAVGEPVGYELVPTASLTLLAGENSVIAKRAAFARRALWVTAYDPAQLHAAGDVANLHPGGAGLPAWTAADRQLTDTDVVLWHTFGVAHVVRPEDWPVMPVETTGFTLRPVGFFDENPALDLDQPGHCH